MMLARRRNPLAAFPTLSSELDRLFDPFAEFGPRGQTAPAINVWDAGDHLAAEVEVPGYQQDQIELFVDGDKLTIKGKREQTHTENVRWHRRERVSGEFTRVLTLPVGIDHENVNATLKDGVLTITLPKAAEAKPRQIAVKGL